MRQQTVTNQMNDDLIMANTLTRRVLQFIKKKKSF